ncbi:MAG: hypothetical protein IJI45_06690 [Anaerolineaceae bacterium]|nr:hypothetical protein [Anaerolineaceae bacterium]
MNDMQTVNATDVRKNWSMTCDNVIRNRPLIFKRTHDEMILASTEDMKRLLDSYKFDTVLYKEDDGSVTAALKAIDLAENGADKETACIMLAEAILDYAEEYYSEFKLYSNAPNRRPHLPYVMKAILLGDPVSVKEEMLCRNGRI